ncbi:hypothetical protein AAG570_003942 [Ranatra chinensis]|uniref:Lipase domain-containing protein n=1 Tax=Ranatra chinensis TaxID=642074 RepID=A0ABD0Y334_9HEMI
MNVQYPNSLSSVPLASADVANLVDALVAANVTSKPQVHMVGYDLGAHVAGSAGSFMSPRPGRITGLDAAGPGYGNGGLDNWLDKNDAVFVDTIHTCGGGYLGVDGEYGHVDFYPNKGTVPQPTCEDTTTESNYRTHYLFHNNFANSTSVKTAYLPYGTTWFPIITNMEGKSDEGPGSNVIGPYYLRARPQPNNRP